MLKLLEFILNHNNWEELLTRDPYNLKVTRDSGYIMFKYNQLCSDFNLPEVREARGIIFRESDWQCVCHAFDKFGNQGEPYCPEIDWSTASVQEKVDGSLMKVWYDDTWHISTNGTIDAFKAPLECANKEITSYGDLFLYCLKAGKHSFSSLKSFTSFLDEEYCYMFEMVSPYNRVVIEYSEPKLYYLGCRDLDSHLEESYVEFNPFENGLGCLIGSPETYPLHTLKEVQEAANALPWNEEGYVVCDANFNRVKIKSPEYVLAHHGRTNGNVSTSRLLEIILNNEIDEFLIYANEYTDKINNLIAEMELFKTQVKLEIVNLAPATYTSRKEYAEVVKKYPSYMQYYLFRYENVDEEFKKINISGWKKILSGRGVI